MTDIFLQYGLSGSGGVTQQRYRNTFQSISASEYDRCTKNVFKCFLKD